MYRIGVAAVLLAAGLTRAAHAEALDARDLYRRAEVLVHSLFGAPAVDRDVVKPPGNIDPQMALVPQPGAAMRMIVPPRPFRQQ